jgi:hypothetical protein
MEELSIGKVGGHPGNLNAAKNDAPPHGAANHDPSLGADRKQCMSTTETSVFVVCDLWFDSCPLESFFKFFKRPCCHLSFLPCTGAHHRPEHAKRQK